MWNLIQSYHSAERILLYESPHFVSCLLKCLNPIQKTLLIRLMLSSRPFPLLILQNWVSDESLLKTCLSDFVSLSIIVHQPDGYIVHPVFLNTLRSVINSPSCLIPLNTSSIIDESFFLDHAVSRFSTLLQTLTSPPKEEEEHTGRVTRSKKSSTVNINTIAGLLVSSGLTDKRLGTITGKGFRFLLSTRRDQLWVLLDAVLDSFAIEPLLRLEMIVFLCKIVSCPAGSSIVAPKYFSFHKKSEDDRKEFNTELFQKFVEILELLGIVMFLKRDNSLMIHTTPFVTLLFSHNKLHQVLIPDVREKGTTHQIIVESNFRVFVFSTNSEILTILKLFLDVLFVLPDCFVCFLTRESICRAVDHGISSDLIISFLNDNPHPSVLCRQHFVPVNVSEHIVLWENELNRLKFTPCVFFSNFSVSRPDIFDAAVVWARSNEALLFVDQQEQSLAVNAAFAQRLEAEVLDLMV
ncbi:hypothetical protein RCL1_005815 [Eukaryota sp. TZLM3-RCL]